MKTLFTSLAALALVGLLGASQAYGQVGVGRGGGALGPGNSYGRIYDVNTVETVKGEVIGVDRVSRTGVNYGVHLQVKTARETISVHLGPSWYLDSQALKIVAKDNIEVTGSRVTVDGKPAIIAGEVKKGDQILKLRDANGFPLWARGRRPN
jgi:hypothetical protein